MVNMTILIYYSRHNNKYDHHQRVYSDPEDDDGFRVLVDRIWPRGMSKRIQSWISG